MELKLFAFHTTENKTTGKKVIYVLETALTFRFLDISDFGKNV